MRTIDRIREYINQQVAKGSLHSGDRLPSYHDFTAIGSGSYATVVAAMKKLRDEGLVDISNGCGTYLSGGKTLHLRLFYSEKLLPPAQFKQLLDDNVRKSNLNMEIELCGLQWFYSQKQVNEWINDVDAVLWINHTLGENPLPPTALNGFKDFKETSEQLISNGVENANYALPFIISTQQIGVNRKLIEKTGFDMERMKEPDFSWWDDYVAACRKHGILPASVRWSPYSMVNFHLYFPLFIQLANQFPKPEGDALFDSEAGRKLLSILKDTAHPTAAVCDESFFSGNAGLNFCIETSLPFQNHKNDWPNINMDFETLPFSNGKHQFLPAWINFLKAYMGETLNTEARNRVWTLMKIMVSKDFQRDFCNGSAHLSSRADMKSSDYKWSGDKNMKSFLPNKNRGLIFTEAFLPSQVIVTLGTILEEFIFLGIKPDTVLKRMDIKKNANNRISSSLPITL